MEIIVGKYSGFCNGVNYTVNKTKEVLMNNDNVYCLGEIVHNEEVVNELEKLGMITVNDINEVPNNSKVILRAHGEPLSTYEIANNKNLEVIDLTCGKIKIIHKEIEKNNDSFIIIIAKHNHPETIGTKGHTKYSFVIESSDEIDKCLNEFKKSKRNKIYVISQTTFNSKKFDELVLLIKEVFKGIDITINKSICNATELRQKEVIELSSKVDLMIIIGGKNSSNTKELYNLAKNNCSNTYLIQNYQDIDFDIDEDIKIGIMAGASTSNNTVEKVINELQNRVKKQHIL